MEIIIQRTPKIATDIAADLIAGLLRKKPTAVLGLATGSTPLLLYRKLVAMKLDWRKVKTFNLDEYLGLSPKDPQSYHYFMWENFFRHINISAKNIHIPDGLAKNIPVFCKHYEKQIHAAGGIDLQILGIGTDGHIGFNEPGSSLASRTRFKTLTKRTRKDNGHYFGNENKVPCHVITMGIGTIMEAKECLVLAFGAKKARAIAGAVEGPITATNPASVLQMHPVTKVFLDEPAASKLKRSDYYRWAFESKPTWQN
ncbi:MAG TPA: glucosamine-6-phosphate deaminase [Verrucomicrobiae bacterium]|nr:glucosamine-6-phosphate deaminase [Verrucomicrobiae bacterium]